MNRQALAGLLVKANAFAPFRFLNRAKLPVLMYHRFSEGEEFGKTSRATFETHLRYLTRHYKIIPLEEAVTRMQNGDGFPPRSAVITVDDGYRDFYSIAFPVLKQYRLPATIYLVTDFVSGIGWIWTDKARWILSQTEQERLEFAVGNKGFEIDLGEPNSRLIAAGWVNAELKRLGDEEKDLYLTKLGEKLGVSVPETPPADFSALTWDNVREMSEAGIEIGSHTATHPILTNISDERLSTELDRSMARIESELGRRPLHFCYPNGNVSRRERDAADSAGYASGVTTQIELCDRGSDTFLIPRIDAEPELYRLVQSTSGFDELKRNIRPDTRA